MKKLPALIVALIGIEAIFFTGCNSFNKPNTKVSKADSVQTSSPKKDTVRDLVVSKSGIDSFLLHPFNLYKFKKKKGEAQGGSWKGEPYFYKPATKGFYWGYMMFPPVFKGYLGKNKKDTVDMENSFEMTTYRPEGKSNNRFDWDYPGEILIELKAKYNDFDLPELAFIGIDADEIAKKIGTDNVYVVNDSCLIYSKNNAVLIFKINGKKVEWLKYEVLKKTFSIDSIPKGLLK
jgi:hypothetical protein